MDSDEGVWLGREAPLPAVMQGCWVELNVPSEMVVIEGSELLWLGKYLEYQDKKLILHEDGDVQVKLYFADQVEGDEINLLAAGGKMGAFSDHFGCLFIRPNA